MADNNFGVIACKSGDKVFVLASGNNTTLSSILSVLKSAIDSTVELKKINISQEEYNRIKSNAVLVNKELSKEFVPSKPKTVKPNLNKE